MEYQSGIYTDGQKATVIRLTKHKKEAEKARDNIFKAIENGIYSESLKARLDTIENEISTLTALIAEAEANCPMLSREQVEMYFQMLRAKKTDPTQYKERLMDTFLNSVYLRPDNSLVLIFNYSGNNNTVTVREIDHLLRSNSPPSGGPDATNTNTIINLINYSVVLIVRQK